MSKCKTVTYYEEFTGEVEQCGKVAVWQGDNGGFACEEHKDSLINPRPLNNPPAAPAIPCRTDDLFEKARTMPPEEFRKEFDRQCKAHEGFSVGSWHSIWAYIKKSFNSPS